MGRLLYNLSGSICVGLGFLGIFLPLLPTTPFLLLAAFCFSRGSAEMHHWLLTHPRMGPIIRDWNEKRVITPRVKTFAVVGVVLLLTPSLVFGDFPIALKAISVCVGLGVIVMIYRQRSN